MKEILKKFIFQEIIFVIIFLLSNILLYQFDKYQLIYPYTTIIFAIITALAFYIIIHFGEKDNTNVLNAFMAVSGVQLFLYIGLFVIYIFTKKPNKIWITIIFMSHYIGFTAFEVIQTIKYLKKKEK